MEGMQVAYYRDRFDAEEKVKKDWLWKILCGYFQRWIPEDWTVLDIGAGFASSSTTSRRQEASGGSRTRHGGYAAPDVDVYPSRAVA